MEISLLAPAEPEYRLTKSLHPQLDRYNHIRTGSLLTIVSTRATGGVRYGDTSVPADVVVQTGYEAFLDVGEGSMPVEDFVARRERRRRRSGSASGVARSARSTWSERFVATGLR